MSKRTLVLATFICVFAFITITSQPVQAGMKRLSSFQESIFALPQKNYILTSKTSLSDQYIDDEQSREFAGLSATKPYTPADEDYPLLQYSLVDSLLLSTDLVLYYGDYSDCFFCAKTRYAYLSRNDVSITSFTPALMPPTVFAVMIRSIDPFSGRSVQAVATTLTNYYVHRSLIRTKSGITENADVLVIHGCYTVWIHHRLPFTKVDYPKFVPKYKAINYRPYQQNQSMVRAGHYSVKFGDNIDPNNPRFGNTYKASLYGPYTAPGPINK